MPLCIYHQDKTLDPLLQDLLTISSNLKELYISQGTSVGAGLKYRFF